jgi:hypothetical protein
VKTEAQKWGETAMAFICSATATGIFAAIGFVFQPTPWLATVSRVLAALCFVIFAIASVTIVKWWIVIARRSRKQR